MKKILVTGASGVIGHNLVNSLLKIRDTSVIAVLGRSGDKANDLPNDPHVSYLPASALFESNLGHVDTLIHTAFSRGDNLLGLTSSIEFTERIIELVNKKDIDSLVNISSQGIYRCLQPGERVAEEGPIGPNTSYGLAKWAVENMIKIGCKKPFTNIRMASLSANARFLDYFVDSVITHKEITVTAPKQYASIMDVADAVKGIISIVNLQINERKEVYNLGPGVQYSILEFAKSANCVGESFGYKPTRINVDDNGKEFAICMDCLRIQNQTGWTPIIGKDEMLSILFNIKKNDEIS